MGRATALRFAEEGAKVMIADRNVAGAQETMAMVKKITPDVDVVAVDVSKWGQVQNMVDRTVERFGRVDVLVNLAAISHAHAAFGGHRGAPVGPHYGHQS